MAMAISNKKSLQESRRPLNERNKSRLPPAQSDQFLSVPVGCLLLLLQLGEQYFFT
jgi:hypothetical protein